MTQETAKRIVDSIVKDLNDRRGLGIDELDDDLQAEIREAWVAIVIKGAK